MHLLIIILQQLLGLLPGGEGKKAPQVELARVPRQNPHNSEPSPCLGLELPRDDWITLLPLYGVTPVLCRGGIEFSWPLRPPRVRFRARYSDDSPTQSG